MNENIRTEAESILIKTYAFPKWQEKIIVDTMLDFHAQQLEKPVERLKSIIEACPKGSFFRKELSKVLKELETTQTL